MKAKAGFRVLGLVLGLVAALAAEAMAQEPPQRLTNQLGMEFVLIPAGSFTMGSPQGEPGRQKNETQHQVTLTRPFYMQTTEVTVGQWREVMGSKVWGQRAKRDDMPVTKVSYGDVQEFIKKLNSKKDGVYQLPTEAQWEYACRAGTTSAFAYGPALSCAQAMFANNTDPFKADECVKYYEKQGLASDRCAPVKSFAPNAWGLYDMHGNVWEWVRDWYHYYPPGDATDPKGPETGNYRGRRGGSFFGGAKVVRSANRNFATPAFRERTLGFRLVLEPPQAR